ncbi:MAG: NADH-quinone oxidoreductase subunit L [Clostridia bacterium]|nr:NADH-quinone oxidoreductase subunit L [Clostridia bacterium]
MNEYLLLTVAILLPAFSALLCYALRNKAVRSFIVVLTSLAMFGVAGGFVNLLLASGGTLKIGVDAHIIGWVIKVLDLLLMGYILYIGFTLRKYLVVVLTFLQLIPLILFEGGLLFGTPHESEIAFVIDYLSLIMILLVSIIGPIITIFATGYMEEHEHHLGLKKSKQPRFFMILFIFLAAMNALVMTDNISWMYFFWEVTTLCSFLLISHDGNSESVKNALRALWINLSGGVAFISAIIAIYSVYGSLSITEIIEKTKTGGFVGIIPLAIGLLCFAGFTKSAQFPFQSWLLGAMVAPTPVSALLHSSTMVKAGVYLVVRFAPAYANTMLANIVAVVGAFTFLAGSAIAISQSNGKRVLAYSTIANLGLIICCAGIGSKVAIGAAILLMIFHAVSKGLLFLCVGTIEQEIGSRDIEDMQGLAKRMPFTTFVIVVGMISMLLPPFGVLITKWLAIEASVNSPLVLLCIVLGSAFTVVFWSKWIGIILTMSYKNSYKAEKLDFSVRSALSLLLVGALAASVLIMPLYNIFIAPHINSLNLADKAAGLAGSNGGVWLQGVGNITTGGFAAIPVFLLLFALMLLIPYFMRKTKAERIKPPYLCGENVDNDVRGLQFISPADKVDVVVVRNYYLTGMFGEGNLTLWCNALAGAIILVMFGVVI